MHKRETLGPTFSSPLADMISKFLDEKTACGCSYKTGASLLLSLDRFLCQQGLMERALPRHLVDAWTAKRPHQRTGTHNGRLSIARQFGLYLQRHAVPAYVSAARSSQASTRASFTPYIFSRSQISCLLTAADQLEPSPHSPLREQVMPEVFRLLYGCGMRVGEVVRLAVGDVDLDSGVLRVRDGKFHHDRLVPVARSMTVRLQQYVIARGSRPIHAAFFAAPDGGPYRTNSIYYTFRQLLRRCCISHSGRGTGPRLHDVRHSFAVHRLEDWYREGSDLQAKLPVLATYMGHQDIKGTQQYLRLTPHLFPDVTAALDAYVGHAIPPKEAS